MVKPPPTDQINKIKLEEEVNKIISNGAPVKEDLKKEEIKEEVKEEEPKKEEKEKWKLVPIRMPEKLLKKVDDKIGKRIGLSRNAWVLGLIQENLEE
jgi:hypothetical protein